MAEYRQEHDLIIFTHTWVPPELRGQGIAGDLLRAGLEFARKKNLRVVPQCSYVDVFIRRHPEFSDLLV